ncbi:NF-kappa-B-repressing factor isoform X4 [Nerophis lumbriciformis]|uniref:NF-kappa-B-repressing factor isoform X4 n=1 Tax=Nerophis lumbriciformis TaxID=546530 RepID=UPI002ADF01B1|nr:NF-kappa-B-repressing factor-like isoform X4 [Nerophis lumbriciformis]
MDRWNGRPGCDQKVPGMERWTASGEMLPFDPYFSSEARKRPIFCDETEEPMRKMPMPEFGSWHGFEPVHFVSSGGGAYGADEKGNDKEPRRSDPYAGWDREYPHASHSSSGRAQRSFLNPAFDQVQPYTSDSWGSHRDRGSERNSGASFGGAVGLGYGGHGSSSNLMTKIQQEYSNKYDARSSQNLDMYSQPHSYNEYGRGNRPDSGRQGLGYDHQDPQSSTRPHKDHQDPQSSTRPHNDHQDPQSSTQPLNQASATSQLGGASQPLPISQGTLLEKKKLIASLASALTSELKDPQFVISTNTSNYSVLLSRSIQTCKTNPQYTYVNLKDIPQADLPKNRKVPAEGYACELRFQGVYLATGYSGSKNGARDRASECAVKLFMKPVTVCTVSRKYYHTVFNDLVVRHRNCFTPSFPPALGKPENIGYPSFKGPYEPDMTKHWTEFVVQENAQDAICILNNSAAFCHMKVDYKFEQLPNASWLCSVYVQDEMVAQATGNKKSSKHFAAVDALERLRKNQASRQPKHPHQKQQQQKKPQETWKTDMSVSGWQFRQRGSKNKHLSELVIFENSDNAICIINDTAQFNKIPADYKFTREPDDNWKCEVFLAGQFVASAVGAKKQVKHTAAEEALATLKQTQAVVKSNLRKDGHNDSISRSQIMGRSDEEAIKQEIKEDNIGNQLLRKMGWKGGGLGRDGEGIAEPIRVKKQFSREGLGLDSDKGSGQLSKQDIEDIIRNYVRSGRQDDLRFASDLTNEERKQIHQMSLHYGLRSKSYGQGSQRFLVVSRKVDANQLIGQLLQEGQVGRYELVKPQASD